MKDLRSQLANAFGRDPSPAAAAEASPDAGPDLLGDEAHLNDPWLAVLRDLVRSVPGAPALADRPKLGQARQVTDTLLRDLKRSGRKRAAKELAQLRKAFDTRREKEAWSRIKARFGEHGLPDRAYRSLKQGDTDPLVVWRRLRRLSTDELDGVGATRLRDLLLG